MTLFLFSILAVCGIALMIWYVANSGKEEKSYQQRQLELAASMSGIYVKDIPDPALVTEALKQAELVGDHLTVTAINNGTYNGPLPERRGDGGWLSIYDNLRILKIAGINHRQGISRYVGRVEYIPSGQTDLVCSLTANEFPYRCTAFIEACEDEDDGHKFFTGFVYIRRLD